ncbi:MAG: trypsin-like peptidase domain-containing protein [Candidatus Hydrogenedentes bacterium]|nr:trypsin-like peptidase domain-containing protein [Candidatus Hydrogenedentota bacterium]
MPVTSCSWCWLATISLAGGVAFAVNEKQIHGNDDRIEVYEETDATILALSRSVCALVADENCQDNSDGTHMLVPFEFTFTDGFGFPVFFCEDEPFLDQPSVAFCTGFLVAPDVIATAGHCVEEGDITGIRVVFGWEMLDAETPASVVPNEQVYYVTEVVDAVSQYLSLPLLVDRLRLRVRDYAVLRLDRPVTVPGAAPLPLRTFGHVPSGALLGIIGHPMGLPKKIAFNATTRPRDNLHPDFFFTNLDNLGGNSGSPVFNRQTGVVEGIAIFDNVSSLWTLEDGCVRPLRVPEGEARSGVLRSAMLSHLTAGGRIMPKLLPVCGGQASPESNAADILVAGVAAVLLLGHLLGKRCRAS